MLHRSLRLRDTSPSISRIESDSFPPCKIRVLKKAMKEGEKILQTRRLGRATPYRPNLIRPEFARYIARRIVPRKYPHRVRGQRLSVQRGPFSIHARNWRARSIWK